LPDGHFEVRRSRDRVFDGTSSFVVFAWVLVGSDPEVVVVVVFVMFIERRKICIE
jgi:hypothetical protein